MKKWAVFPNKIRIKKFQKVKHQNRNNGIFHNILRTVVNKIIRVIYEYFKNTELNGWLRDQRSQQEITSIINHAKIRFSFVCFPEIGNENFLSGIELTGDSYDFFKSFYSDSYEECRAECEHRFFCRAW